MFRGKNKVFHAGLFGNPHPFVGLEFFGIKIYMYWKEHFPPHFHAQYNEFQVLIDINESVVIKGNFPFKQLKLVLAWSELHKIELLKNWKLAQEHSEIIRIAPLQ